MIGLTLRKFSLRLFFGACLILTICAIFLCSSVGPDETVRAWNIQLWKDYFQGKNSPQTTILFLVRIPRVLLATLVGATLALAGLVFQSLLRNPLADPFIIGVSGGASFAAVIVQVLNIHNHIVLSLAAFLGGILTVWIVKNMTARTGMINRYVLILTGVMLNAFFSAAITFLLILAGSDMPRIFWWLMGSLSLPNYTLLFPMALIAIIVAFILFLFSHAIDVLSLGDLQAYHLGFEPEKLKKILLFSGSILTAIAVSMSGMIGFVGMFIPHLMRLLLGGQHRVLIPFAILTGGVFLAITDTLIRLSPIGTSIPIGTVTAALGAPFFLVLLFRKRGNFLR